MTKTNSKRKTLRQKYKIKKKVAEHKRQQKKATKKAKTLGLKKSKLRKNTDIPNSYPFKKEVLQAIQTKKELELEDKMEKRQAKKAEKKRKRESGEMGSVEDLQRRAQIKQMEYESKSELTAGDEEQSLHSTNDGSRKAYFREFRKVVDESDVILEVLDARDPMGCRCIEIEKFIMQRDPNKRIVLVMNKIDLVPKDNIQDWLASLRKNLPTIAFKSSTQQQNSRIGRVNKSISKLSESQLKLTQCIGADTLMKLLKNYTRNQNIKTAITVGVIGYPNVGKSSLINSLKREKVAGVGATPGFTKVKQEIHLDKNIRLLDCPGIVFSSRETTETGIMLRSNAIKVQQIGDPAAAVELIVRQCQKEKLMMLYGIADFDGARDFLRLVAQKRGKMKRGGIPNFDEIARAVIQDWNQGKVPFYTIPSATSAPSSSSSSSSSSVMTNDAVGAQIVTTWAKEFDIGALLADDDAVLEAGSHPMDAEQLSSGSFSNFDGDMIDEMQDVSKPAGTQLAFGTVKKRKTASSNSGSMEVEGLSDSLKRKDKKKKKKEKMEEPEGLRVGGGDYDFSDFAAFAKLEGHAESDDSDEESDDDEELEGEGDDEDEDDEDDEDSDEELVDME